MIIYNNTKEGFLCDVNNSNIEDILEERFNKILKHNIGRSEYLSRQNSLMQMYLVINKTKTPDDAKICLEYNIPGSSKRIDFIISGLDECKKETLIIIELKQRQKIKITNKDAIVMTRFSHGLKETSHPSYQARSYVKLLKGFNEVVYSEEIELYPCAYLHNYKEDGIISNQFYSPHIEKAPIFLKGDKQKLADFISKYIKFGDKGNIMYRIDNGKIRPSKALADSMASMLKGKQEFIMIDDQKVVYENAIDLAKKSTESNKNVLIVKGGPGTGKSVVAINLLVNLIKNGRIAQYVTKNAAPRAVYESKLTGTLKKTEFSNLFKGSGSYINANKNEFDALIVDEAHRLNEKSGVFSNLGENQIKEIIDSSKFSIFFIDENQRVTFKDIGEKEEIIKWAAHFGAKIHLLELASQFRCNGSDGYLAWLDNSLQIRETANISLKDIDYDFQVFDNPSILRDKIFELNKINNKSRMVAGYCWDWVSKKHKNIFDICFPKYNFAMKRNLATDGMLWILQPDSVSEIGCIHTCQGLELDYVGVIIGDDFIVRNGEVLVNPSKRAKTDISLKGYKKKMLINPQGTESFVKSLIKNTYRTLMTRGMKGCYLYCVDKETREYFKSII